MLRHVQKMSLQKTVRVTALTLLCTVLSGGLQAETLGDVFQEAKQNDALLKSQAAQAAAGRG